MAAAAAVAAEPAWPARALTFLDVAFTMLVFGPFIPTFWFSTWSLQDEYMATGTTWDTTCGRDDKLPGAVGARFEPQTQTQTQTLSLAPTLPPGPQGHARRAALGGGARVPELRLPRARAPPRAAVAAGRRHVDRGLGRAGRLAPSLVRLGLRARLHRRPLALRPGEPRLRRRARGGRRRRPGPLHRRPLRFPEGLRGRARGEEPLPRDRAEGAAHSERRRAAGARGGAVDAVAAARRRGSGGGAAGAEGRRRRSHQHPCDDRVRDDLARAVAHH
mmetsp:Transcript_20149/g.61157  ORF Transcript_20149/g.61157 Transcript_20149/m.61157 type:complete len:275 (-) Transcript_20149:250-1074(-)